MTLHFAYGSNMSRGLMEARCPGATVLGLATLTGWRFVINPDGCGSIVRQPGGMVYGVLWRLTPRDLSAVNAYEKERHIAVPVQELEQIQRHRVPREFCRREVFEGARSGHSATNIRFIQMTGL